MPTDVDEANTVPVWPCDVYMITRPIAPVVVAVVYKNWPPCAQAGLPMSFCTPWRYSVCGTPSMVVAYGAELP